MAKRIEYLLVPEGKTEPLRAVRVKSDKGLTKKCEQFAEDYSKDITGAIEIFRDTLHIDTYFGAYFVKPVETMNRTYKGFYRRENL